MTGCVAIAWPDAQKIPGETDVVPRVSGTLTCTSAAIEGLRAHARHTPQRSANAVGVYAPPGFKSRSLRLLTSSLSPIANQGGLLVFAFQAPCAHIARTSRIFAPLPITSLHPRRLAVARAFGMPGFRACSPP
jgi:hypothetical protein